MKYLYSLLILLVSINLCTANIVPDTVPTTQNIGHMSTRWDDFVSVSPSEQIPLIQAPKAGSTGNAHLAFPIKLPQARQDHMPDIQVLYNNEGGPSWLGTGWDLSISSFTLDTRWGVPTFDEVYESEIYLFDGHQMGPVFHRAIKYERESNRTFHLRQEGSFQKIIRHGNGPTEYWWEVREKDGRIHYYGGNPSTGADDSYLMVNAKNQITEWLLCESRDVYDNFIKYKYQKSQYRGGTEVYPRMITYNGIAMEEGNYSIEFELGATVMGGSRKDAALDCRTSSIRSISQLLDKIIIRYKDQTIRSYQFEYLEGVFHKTLLTSIAEHDQDNEEFYKYEFEYYEEVTEEDGIVNLWNTKEEWSVPKDNIDVLPVSATNAIDFLKSPTILGGAKSWNVFGGLAVVIGFVAGNPATKENTVGVNGGGGTSNGSGVIALVDINGDGMPDKVWKENEKLYYRPNLKKSAQNQNAFGNKVELLGITDFSKSNTISWNAGGELTAGVSEASVFVGYSHEQNNTKITTYFADFNGDDLMDIASDRRVFFNSIGPDGHPRFTQNSGDTYSPIFRSEVEPPVIVDSDEQAEVEAASPLHDAVRVWLAPIDGFVNVSGSVTLLPDMDPSISNIDNLDGVTVMVQHNEDELWRQEIEANDFAAKTPLGLGSILVQAGDSLFFRTHSRYNGYGDQVSWDPIIQYLGEDSQDKDANGLPHYRYQASQDFLLSQEADHPLSASGIVDISAYIKKPVLSDSLFFQFRGGIVFDTVFGPSENIEATVNLTQLHVNKDTEFTVSVWAKTNVDWSSLEFLPTVTYTTFDDGSPVNNADGSPLITICPVVDYQTYPKVESFGHPFIAPRGGRVKAIATFDFFAAPPRTAHFSLKSHSSPDSTKTIDTLIASSSLEMNLEMDVESGDTLYLDLHYQNFPILNQNNVRLASCAIIMDMDTMAVDCGVYYRNQNDLLSGSHYRGWGQFAYNANDGRGGQSLILGELAFDEDAVAGDTSLIDEGNNPGDIEGTIINMDDLFIVMSADPKSKAWRGSDAHTYVARSSMASSRNGNQDVDLSASSGNIGDAFPAPVLKTKSVSNAVAGEVGPVGGGLTFATSFSKIDITDMNGDRYPDYIYEDRIQYTDARGGLSETIYQHQWGIHEADSRAEGISIGGSFVGSSAKNSTASMGKGSNKRTSRIRSKGKGKLSGARNAFKASGTAIGLSGSLTFDSDWTKHTFIDINGDGLEDKVWEDGQVALNLGYSFAQPMDWGFEGIQEGDAIDGGGGVGINYVSGSIMAGLSASRTDNHSTLGFLDINDDALVDRVISTRPMVVQMNTGSGFGEAKTLNEDAKMDEGFSIGESTNLAGTVCIPFFLIRICFNPSTSIGQGTSSVGHAFDDIDGDGYIDILSAHDDDSNLAVRSSHIGATNMLKTIHLPQHGRMNFSYSAQGNTPSMPYSKWVLSSYTVNDGIAGDGIDEYAYEIHYQNPVHDRHERQFYGFQIVDEIQISNDNENQNRTLRTEYCIDNFYTHGMVKAESILGFADTLYQRTEYSYSLRDVVSGQVLPPSAANRDDGMAWPTLDQKKVIMTEGSDASLSRTYQYGYDSLGNELTVEDADQSGSIQKTIRTYDYNDEKYLMSNISTESIFGNGVLYRYTEYKRDSNGNLIQLREQLDDQSFIVTDMSYDAYGNLKELQNPANYKGERLIFIRNYDEEEHQYLIYEKDGYGYEKHFTHEYLYNQMTSSTDINGHSTLFEVDKRGRAKKITYPYEIAAQLPYSIRFEYFPDAETAHAIAYHYDPVQEDDLDVIAFEDGLQRTIQTKVRSDISINGQDQVQYIVSGLEEFDLFGRKSKSFLPTTTPIATNQTLTLSGTGPFTTHHYDVFDRPLEVVDVYGARTTYRYLLDYTRAGELALCTKVTDPFGNSHSDYFNTRGNLLAERYDGPNGDIWRSLKYDGYSQVVNVLDPINNATTYGYDMLGRRISVKVPDAGTTELIYDDAGNLTERITATIRDVIAEDGSIRYQYDKERLVQIDYPKHFQNKVQIHYGPPQDSFNRAGRIWLQEDATGGREYFFDANGHPTKTIRTVMINRSKIFTYVSEAEYDTWGRVLKYFYPDGECLSYKYNRGGRLSQLSGEKNGKTHSYLTYAGYDKYTDLVMLQYGNGVQDEYTYDDKGRLALRKVKDGSGSQLMDETYMYDPADNLKSRSTNGAILSSLGGSIEQHFDYDILHRMTQSSGSWSGNEATKTYELFYDFDDLNNLTSKDQILTIDDEVDTWNSHAFEYEYEYADYPSRPSKVGGKDYHYDANGNLLLSNSQAIFQYDQNIFDEENRLLGTSNNGYISRYTYDAFGIRTLKSHGETQGVFINGAPAGFLEHKTNFRVDVSPYFTVFEDDYHKHYYLDEMRVLSKIGTGVFQTSLGQGPDITAGGIDYKSRIQQYEQSILDYYGGLGVPPGPPTLLAHLGQPEINENALPDASNQNPYNKPPTNWPNIAAPDTMGPPGPPVFFDFALLDNENVKAGYNFTSGSIAQEIEHFYYHYDHQGSMAYITDLVGEARQHASFLPSGERWLHNTTTSDQMEYMYNSLLFDEESAMYDLGNVYFDPVTNIEQSIDPTLQHFGESTFRKRPEGDFYYDYALIETDEDPGFDNEVLNSENPDPFLSNSKAPPIEIDGPEPPLLTHDMVLEAVGGQPLDWDISSIKIDSEHPFAKEIAQLIPYLIARNDLSDPKTFKKIVKEVIVKPERRKQYKELKAYLRKKFKRKARTKRKVRF